MQRVDPIPDTPASVRGPTSRTPAPFRTREPRKDSPALAGSDLTGPRQPDTADRFRRSGATAGTRPTDKGRHIRHSASAAPGLLNENKRLKESPAKYSTRGCWRS